MYKTCMRVNQRNNRTSFYSHAVYKRDIPIWLLPLPARACTGRREQRASRACAALSASGPFPATGTDSDKEGKKTDGNTPLSNSLNTFKASLTKVNLAITISKLLYTPITYHTRHQHFNGANPHLAYPTRNPRRLCIKEVTCHFFSFYVADLKSAVEKICRVVYYVHYTTDLPFK